MIEDLKLGDVMRLVEAMKGPVDPGRQEIHGWAIVVLDRGFVYVGMVTTNADWCLIEGARNIRRWGTTRGLGQLVFEGPMANTNLDAAGTVKAPMRAVISIHPTREELWNKS